MEYKLAKELKEAGFPNALGVDDFAFLDRTEFGRVKSQEDIDRNAHWVKIPTLSELIEACGQLEAITKERSHAGDEWCALTFYGHRNARGSTPEEAVARLWLALNKKQL